MAKVAVLSKGTEGEDSTDGKKVVYEAGAGDLGMDLF